MKTLIPTTIPLAGWFIAAAAVATAEPAPEPPDGQPLPIDRLFERLDTNHDGVLSREEFRAIRPQERPVNPPLRPERPEQPRPEPLQALIQRFDTDGDGRLSWDEFKASPAGARGEQAFQRLDRNGDGFITPDEFRLREQPPPQDRPERPVRPQPPEPPAPRPPIQLFRKLDTDNSGTLTFDEFKAVAGNNADADKVEARFQRLDSDGDGVLTLDEFARRNRPLQEDGGPNQPPQPGPDAI